MAIKTKITRADIKIFPSERLTDNEDGGGMALGTALTGEPNELFNPISALANLYGYFGLRGIHMGLMRGDDEPLIGSFAAITEPPKNPSVSYLLFRASKYGELRKEILKRIEAFNVATIESRMTLLSTQSKYSRIVQAYQTVGEPLPQVGDIYCLRQDKHGWTYSEQYIQVIKQSSEVREFVSPSGAKFKKTVIKLEISTPLEADFVGVDYPRPSYVDNPCKIRETHGADAAQYYGIKPLAKAISKESTQIKVHSLMEKLVPTNQIESRLEDLTAAGQRQTLFDAARVGSDGILTLAVNKAHNAGEIYSYYCGNAITPASLVMESNSGKITDVGGTLMLGKTAIGSVSYARGEALINNVSNNLYINSLSFRPAAAELRVSDTAKIDIAINNRSYNYVLTIDPPPSPGSLQVSYRAQGRWYDLRDNGDGKLVGISEGHGSGNVNFVTGTVGFTTGELPDVGSSILLAWSNKGRYFNRAGATAKAELVMQLTEPADASSISLKWNDGADKTAHCDSTGKITGDWTGLYDESTHQIRIDTQTNFSHPAGVLEVNASYNSGEKKHQQHKAPLRNSEGKITLDLGDRAIKPYSFKMRFNLLIEDYQGVVSQGESYYESEPNWVPPALIPASQMPFLMHIDPYLTLRDDGNGKIVDKDGKIYGDIDYSNRTLVFNPETTVSVPRSVYKKVRIGEKRKTVGSSIKITPIFRSVFSHYEYQEAGASMPYDESGLVECWFYDDDPATAREEELSTKTLEIDLLDHYAEVIAPASVNFVWGNKRYFDREGKLFTDLNPKTGAAKLAGTINYQTNRATLTDWHYSDGKAPAVLSLATSIEGNPVDAATFRTPSSPLRPASLQVRATVLDGTKINAIAEFSGQIKAANITGFVEAEYGVVDVRFGQWVDAAGNESEPWYNADAVEDGKIFKPKHVFAETITFNAVSYSYLPIDSEVVKVNTVRLPQDGRVPIFRRGDAIIISNKACDDIGSAHTAGQTVQLSRDDVDRICVSDAKNKPVNANLWDYDLDAGTVSWLSSASGLDLSDYQMPLKVTHIREDRNRILQCDIDGTLSLIFPTKRAYAVENTYVSSLLVGGDLQVRCSIPFTQRNWNGHWSDSPVGSQLLNKLNLKDYPPILTDDGAVQERWLIKMTGGGQFQLWGQTLGFVLYGSVNEDLAPINPATNKPFFIIPKGAFGNKAPWASQDIIRFNTWGTLMSAWLICAVQPSSNVQEGEDGFSLSVFVDTTELTN